MCHKLIRYCLTMVAAGLLLIGAASICEELPTASWPVNGGDLYNRRYSPLDLINTDNVSELKGYWHTQLNASGVGPQYSGEAEPLVVDDKIFIVTGANDVFALDLDSGKILWTYEAKLDPSIDTICCSWTSRGLGQGDGMIFVGQLDGKLVALDIDSGDVAWSTQAERWQDGYTITSAPLFLDGLVITGFAGADMGTRGRVNAYSANDGSMRWKFYTIPAPGEAGHETWPDNDIWKYGGANVWQTPAADPELGLIYFATANAAPDYNGSQRVGDNLFSSSIVAIEAATGKYRWHYQFVHHDIWDYDGANPVVLFDIEIKGRMRKAAAHAGKTGWVYILDRTNGKPLIGIDDRPVPQEPRQATAATQPYPQGDAFVPQSVDIPPEGWDLVNGGRIFTPYWTDGVVLKPHAIGGANWPPSSYDPTTQTLFVCAGDRMGLYKGGDRDFDVPENPGKGYIGGEFARLAIPTMGIFAALDMKTNTLVWQQRWADQCYSGSIVTAGGLLFVGRSDGRLTAMSSKTGHRLWEFQTGAGMNSTVSTVEKGGKQYVIAYAAGNMFAHSQKGDHVWLFRLDGSVDPQPVSHSMSFAAKAPEKVEAFVVDAEQGAAVYATACQFCHGANGESGHNGVALVASMSVEEISEIVTRGRNEMPAFKDVLSAEELFQVSSFVAYGLLEKR